jgi:small subunit ribosomal protein S2
MSDQNKHTDVVSMRQLLECGVHFGHQTKRWNPKMKRYIFTSRNGIHVIDLQQTIKLIKKTYQVVKEVVRNGGTVLFVGTKKQAQEAIEVEARRCGMPFVSHRWLGGTLTNNVTLRHSINKLKQHQRIMEDGTIDLLSNKEGARKRKILTRLTYYLDGIRDMNRLPSMVFIIDTKREALAIRESNKLKIPIIGVVDTNADPTEVQYPIPANDDAIRAIKLLCSVISKAVLDGQAERAGIPPVVVEVAAAVVDEPDDIEDAIADDVLLEDDKDAVLEEAPRRAVPVAKVAAKSKTPVKV